MPPLRRLRRPLLLLPRSFARQQPREGERERYEECECWSCEINPVYINVCKCCYVVRWDENKQQLFFVCVCVLKQSTHKAVRRERVRSLVVKTYTQQNRIDLTAYNKHADRDRGIEIQGTGQYSDAKTHRLSHKTHKFDARDVTCVSGNCYFCSIFFRIWIFSFNWISPTIP